MMIPRDTPNTNVAIGFDTLTVFSKEVADWRYRQGFNSDSEIDPLVGVLEEVCEVFDAEGTNEIAHYVGIMMKAFLKSSQGISGTDELHASRYNDARENLMRLLQSEDSSWANLTSVIDVYQRDRNEEKIRDGVGDICVYLADYCSRNNIDFGSAVSETWNKVSKRDWSENKLNGGDAEKIAEGCKS